MITYSYGSANQATAPGELTEAQRIQYLADDYTELMTLTCNLPATASEQLLGMSYHLSAYGNAAFGHHVGANLADSYVTSPENSLEFFPLDGSNYITHAEITEGGTGVLIEYAQAVTDNTSQSYSFTAVDGSVITLTSDTIWLNDRTVWLSLGSDIYTGVNTATAALDADRHVLVASRFPNDSTTDGFGNNFDQASTYRAVLTRHMSPMDYARTAPTITAVTVAPGTGSIDLTFSETVCGATETGCDSLTAEHFEVMYYGGTETDAPTPLDISSVDVTGTVATLGITLPPLVNIDSNDYVLVRTARNSRFSDTFITDRTIFTQSSTPTGMLHLQSGALVRAIPTIVYSLTNPSDAIGDYSIGEGDIADGAATTTFTVTRTPAAYDSASSATVTITRTSDSNSDNPDNFVVTVDGTAVTESAGVWTQVITFTVGGDDSKTIDIQHTGNDAPNDDYIYTINVAPDTIPGSGSRQLTFTIEDDEDDIPPTLPGNRNIVADEGATQVTLNFESAYDTIGSAADSSGRTYTRNVNYVITFTRMENDDSDKPALTLPSITVSAARAIVSETGLGLNTTEIFTSRPSPEILAD